MIRSLACSLLLLVFLSSYAHSKAKKDAEVPALFRQASFVYVEAVDGDEFSFGLTPEDRQAIADVEKAIQTWNRYQLTARRGDAELVFVVRKGRLATAKVNAGVHVGTRTPGGPAADRSPDDGLDRDPGRGPNYGTRIGASGEVGPGDDLLIVESLDKETRQPIRIWTQSEKDGLNTPGIPLFKQMKDAVEKAYPRQTPSAQQGP